MMKTDNASWPNPLQSLLDEQGVEIDVAVRDDGPIVF
jgi:hypothetical protein